MDLRDIPKPNYPSPAEHSEYSPSGSSRWLHCTASISLLRTIKRENKSNFYADEGTAAHALGEDCLNKEVSAASRVGKKYGNKNALFTVDKSMAREVQKYIDYVNDSVPLGGILFVENRVSLEHLKEGMFGTADAIIVGKNYVEVCDLKYGRGIAVEAGDNTQMMIYAIGVLAHLSRHGYRLKPTDRIKMTIIQPRAPHPEGPIRYHEITIQELKDFQETVKAAIADSCSPNPSFCPTEKGCRWCEAAPICKAYANYNLEIARLEFADFDKPKREMKQSFKDQSTLSIEEVMKIYEHSKAMKQWLDSIEAYVIEEGRKGTAIPGYKLVYGRSNRKFANPAAVVDLASELEIPDDLLFNEAKMRSPAQLEKEVDEEVWEKFNELVTKPQGKIVLAPESDARMEVNADKSAADDWKDEVW